MSDDGNDGAGPSKRLTARARRQRDAELGIHNLPGEHIAVVSVERPPTLLLTCDPNSVFLSRERRDDEGQLHVRARVTPTSGQIRISTLLAVMRDAEGNPIELDDRGIGASSANPIDLAAELGVDARALHAAHSIELVAEVEHDISELFLSAATGPRSAEAGRQPWPITLEDLPPPHPPIRATLGCFTRHRDTGVNIDFVLGVTPAFEWIQSLSLDFEFRVVDADGRPLAREGRGCGGLQPHRARVIRARIYDLPLAQLEQVRGIEIDIKTKVTRWESLGVFVVDPASDPKGAAAPLARGLERARARDRLSIGEAYAVLRDAGVSILETELAALAGERELESSAAMSQALSTLSAEARVLLDAVLDRIAIDQVSRDRT